MKQWCDHAVRRHSARTNSHRGEFEGRKSGKTSTPPAIALKFLLLSAESVDQISQIHPIVPVPAPNNTTKGRF
jgi:hypothetical protein